MSNKKIGIITINDFNNYGNRLQCYAVQEVLKDDGYIVENIYNNGIGNFKIIIREAKHIVKVIFNINNERKKINRKKCFKDFNQKIKFSKFKIINNKVNKKLNEYYNYFIVGSDQVWNPFFENNSMADLLNFANAEKRIAFAASFGVDSLPKNKYNIYEKELQYFRAISVREKTAKNIIEKMNLEENVEVIVDPTMLLSAEKWDEVAKKPIQYQGQKYILNYFLGDLSIERKNEIYKIAKNNGYEVINILDKKDKYYATGPSEFIWLEKNAELICTDSFHSSVFAILYKKPFIVFDRIQHDSHKMNSRIENLIENFKLKNRKYNEKNITDENLKCDYTEAYKILDNERIVAKNFLKYALKEELK